MTTVWSAAIADVYMDVSRWLEKDAKCQVSSGCPKPLLQTHGRCVYRSLPAMFQPHPQIDDCIGTTHSETLSR
jgi:hypothetical protein